LDAWLHFDVGRDVLCLATRFDQRIQERKLLLEPFCVGIVI
jgi:hypothetical protein